MPAGHLDGNESVTAAMIREAREGLCVDIDPKTLNVIHVMHRIKDDGERIDLFLTTADWQGEIKIGEPNKCDDLQWFRIDNLPSNTIPYIKFATQQYITKQTFSEYGW